MSSGILKARRARRKLSDNVVTFQIRKEFDAIKAEPEWLSGDRNAVTVVKTFNLSIVLVAMRKGATLCGHEVEGPITLQVLSGAVKFRTAEPEILAADAVLALDKAIPHDIEALEDSDLMLTIVKEVR
jgi:quercetin dioxygenase-like cupin family protein